MNCINFLWSKLHTQCPKLIYTVFKTLFLSSEMRQKYNFCCVYDLEGIEKLIQTLNENDPEGDCNFINGSCTSVWMPYSNLIAQLICIIVCTELTKTHTSLKKRLSMFQVWQYGVVCLPEDLLSHTSLTRLQWVSVNYKCWKS